MPNYIAQCKLVLNLPNGGPDIVQPGEVRYFDKEPPKGKTTYHWVPVIESRAPKAEAK